MAALDRQTRAPIGFVAASSGVEEEGQQATNEGIASNPDALDVDLDD